MIITACVDDRMGLRFCKRRLSKDAALRARLLALSGGELRMSGYSAKQFETAVYAGDDYLSAASTGDWCFCEDTAYLDHAANIEKIVLFKWNRTYPADEHFTFPGEWKLVSAEDFPGNSHEKLTMEVYEK